MVDNTKNLEQSWNNRSNSAKERALAAIAELKVNKLSINFNSVHIKSGVSKNFLYTNEEIKAIILAERDVDLAQKREWKNKYDKTSKSKDVIIATKDKYIIKLETENKQLRKELSKLRAMIYEQK